MAGIEMSIEPRNENELTTNLELHTPEWLSPYIPNAKLSVSYRKLWDRRRNNFIEKAIKRTGLTEDEFYRRLEQADTFADIFEAAATKSIKHGDEEVADILARLVAAALDPNTAIDEASYLLARLSKLDPVHIRILGRFGPLDDFDPGEILASVYSNTLAVTESTRHEAATLWDDKICPAVCDALHAWNVNTINGMSRVINANAAVTGAAMNELVTANMLENLHTPVHIEVRDFPRMSGALRFTIVRELAGFRLSDLGKTLRGLIDEVSTEHHDHQSGSTPMG
jgi:hypothetical protein